MKFLILCLGALVCLSVASAGSADGCKKCFRNAINTACKQLKDDCQKKCTDCVATAEDAGIHQCLKDIGLYEMAEYVSLCPCFDIAKLLPQIKIDSMVEKGAGCFPDENPCDQMESFNIEELVEHAKKNTPEASEDQTKCVAAVKDKYGAGKVDEFKTKCSKFAFKGVGRHAGKCNLACNGICKKFLGLSDEGIGCFKSCATGLKAHCDKQNS